MTMILDDLCFVSFSHLPEMKLTIAMFKASKRSTKAKAMKFREEPLSSPKSSCSGSSGWWPSPKAGLSMSSQSDGRLQSLAKSASLLKFSKFSPLYAAPEVARSLAFPSKPTIKLIIRIITIRLCRVYILSLSMFSTEPWLSFTSSIKLSKIPENSLNLFWNCNRSNATSDEKLSWHVGNCIRIAQTQRGVCVSERFVSRRRKFSFWAWLSVASIFQPSSCASKFCFPITLRFSENAANLRPWRIKTVQKCEQSEQPMKFSIFTRFNVYHVCLKWFFPLFS